MQEDLILTFDLGTTRLKVAAFDIRGELKGLVSRRNRDYREGNRQWQSASDWWNDAVSATSELIAGRGLDPRRIKGVSLSGRAGAAVFVDGADQVIMDPWSDTRHRDQLREIIAGHDRADLALYGATLLSKIMWLRNDDPELAARARHVLYAKDFLLFRLTGEAVTDPSSGPDGPWDEALLERCEVAPALVPRPLMPWDIAGTVNGSAAAALGLVEGIPVAVGAHDGICANAGAAAAFPGQYAITLGTHAVVRAVTDFRPDGARRFYGFPPDKHIIGGNALMAGRSLDWFLDNWFGATEEGRQELFATLDDAAARIDPGASGIVFLPFLRGQIAPEKRPGARAAFFGLETDSDRQDMYRAVLEGASFALAAIFDEVTGWAGEPSHIGVTGGGANSNTWTQLLADIIQHPLSLTDGACEGRGAAIFCATALGYYPSLKDAIANMVATSRTVVPGPAGTYRELREHWQAVSASTRPFDKRM